VKLTGLRLGNLKLKRNYHANAAISKTLSRLDLPAVINRTGTRPQKAKCNLLREARPQVLKSGTKAFEFGIGSLD